MRLAYGLIVGAMLIALLLFAQPLVFVDRYQSTLSAPCSSPCTSISVTSASGLPSGATYFFATVKADGAHTEEVFLVTSISGTTLTVTGAKAGTAASSHGSGAQIIASIMTKDAFTQMKADTVAAVPAVTTGVAGLAPVLSNDDATYLNGIGTYTVPGAMPLTSWSFYNCTVGTGCNFNNFNSKIINLTLFDSGSLNWRLAMRTLPSSTSYTVIAQIDCRFSVVANSASCGLYVTDGTKLEGIELLNQSSANSGQLRVQKITNATTDGSSLAGATTHLIDYTPTFKIVGTASKRTFFYYANGAFVQMFQENIGTNLTETSGGFGGNCTMSSGVHYVSVNLLYWSLTNP